jgi:hypothetical protein
VLLQNLLIHDFYEPSIVCPVAPCPPNPTEIIDLGGIRLSGDGDAVLFKSVTVRNTMIWDGDKEAIRGDEPLDRLVIENCSIDQMRDAGSRGIYADNGLNVTIRNTIVTGIAAGAFTGSNNTSTDGSAALYFANPQTGASIYVTPNLNLLGVVQASCHG